jgi:hypothetical protein
MLIQTAAALIASFVVSTAPNTYNERWLCDLWAGAQCHATSCEPDAKTRCLAVSKQCEQTSRSTRVDDAKSMKRAACARALLKGKCGQAKPAECDGLM